MVRHAVPGDARRIAEITVAGWMTAYVGIVPDDVRHRQNVERHLAYWLTDEAQQPPMQTWVAEANGCVVGYAHAGPFRPEPGEDSEAGELWGIYVDPDHWGHGHGHALMAVVVDHFRLCGYDAAYLWVMRNNERARRFYERGGWEVDDGVARVDPMQEVRYRYDPSRKRP
jgi:GNAT superfamily N-acetyltransferase